MSQRNGSICRWIKRADRLPLLCTQCRKKRMRFEVSWLRFYDGKWITATTQVCKKEKCLGPGIKEVADRVRRHIGAENRRKKRIEEIAALTSWKRTVEELSEE